MGWLIRFFVKQGVFAELLTVIVLVLGVGSVYLIQREAFPNVQYDAIMITTIYPGAAAEEVERLITNVLEQDLKEVDGIKRMQSVSTESRSLIFLQLDPDQTTEAEAKEDVQQVVDQFTGLPDGAERPMVAALETRQMPIMEVGLSGGANEMELRASAKALERVIEDIPEVAKVQFNGLRDLEIRNAILAKAQGIGFAIPSQSIRQILPQLRKTGKVERGYIGILLGEVSAQAASFSGGRIKAGQPFVSQLEKDGPAAQSGLQVNDILLAVRDQPVKTASDVLLSITAQPVGAKTTVRVLRDSGEKMVTITVGKRPVS